jgi:hypothetical protein
MRNLIFCFLLFLSTISVGQSKDTSESWQVEMSANISYYNSLSISVEKSFNYGKWIFGPRLELVNLFGDQSYIGEDDSTYSMQNQIRVRLAQIEYQINPRLRIGIAPFWMLGPLPKRGFYKTPSSIYAHLQIKEGLSLETSFTNSNKEMVQLSFRKAI